MVYVNGSFNKNKTNAKEISLNTKDMADILGYKTAKAYHDIESGRTKLKLEHIKKLSTRFNIPVEKFFDNNIT